MKLSYGAVVGALSIFALHCGSSSSTESESIESQASYQTNEAKFLVADGRGSSAEAIAYYETLGANVIPGTYTLDQWVTENMGQAATNATLYKNGSELGFWREMKCTQYIGRGLGGCMVRNWNDPGDQAAGKPDLGTVAMNVSAQGFTRFYVFAPGGKLSPFAILDDEGEKYVPEVCISCHNGTYFQGASSNMGAIFREFEPSQLQAPPGTTPSQAAAMQRAWFNLNQSIRSANFALKTEKEGGAYGVDHAKKEQESYVKAIYGASSTAANPVPKPVGDPSHLPASWAATGDTPTLLAAKKDLWTKFVAPYCMTCHRTNNADWADYQQFAPLAFTINGTKSFLELYIAKKEDHDDGFPYMPQAKLLFDQLQADQAAKTAVANWLTAVGGPVCEPGTSCVPSKACFKGAIPSCTSSGAGLTCKATTPLPNGTPCNSGSGSCNNGECIPSISFSIPRIPTGIYVRDKNPGEPEAHVHLETNHDLFITQVNAKKLCKIALTTYSQPCNTTTLTCTATDTQDAWKVLGPATMERKYPGHPELNGIYRRESPVDLPACP
jgi:hypothetical protein